MDFDYRVVLPVIIVTAYALLGLLLTPTFRGSARALAVSALLGLGVAGVSIALLGGFEGSTANGLVMVDDFARFFDVVFLIAGAVAVLGSVRYLERADAHHGEYYALILIAVAGMMTMVGSENLLTIFLGLELLSIPLYILAGFTRRRIHAVESSLKYFLLGAFSTGIILYGMAFIYGACRALHLRAIAQALQEGTAEPFAFALGLGLVLAGFAFKIAAVPFHAWAPDVYQGAPTPVAALMAAGTKAAAFGALLRVVHTALPVESAIDWRGALAVLAILTMTVANLIAIAQQNVKRLLAYSSIAHAGYLLVAVVSPVGSGIQSAAFYLLAYTFMTMGAFIVAAVVGRSTEEGEEGYTLASYAGLGRRRPLLALAMTLFMLSLTGIPPTAGFVGKLYIFKAAIGGGHYVLAVIGLVNSAIAAYYYLGLVVAMWMQREAPGPEPSRTGLSAGTAIALSTVATLALGLYPGPILDLARDLYLSLGPQLNSVTLPIQ
jgi:NADH-quinone oxidoreductase subunit N